MSDSDDEYVPLYKNNELTVSAKPIDDDRVYIKVTIKDTKIAFPAMGHTVLEFNSRSLRGKQFIYENYENMNSNTNKNQKYKIFRGEKEEGYNLNHNGHSNKMRITMKLGNGRKYYEFTLKKMLKHNQERTRQEPSRRQRELEDHILQLRQLKSTVDSLGITMGGEMKYMSLQVVLPELLKYTDEDIKDIMQTNTIVYDVAKLYLDNQFCNDVLTHLNGNMGNFKKLNINNDRSARGRKHLVGILDQNPADEWKASVIGDFGTIFFHSKSCYFKVPVSQCKYLHDKFVDRDLLNEKNTSTYLGVFHKHIKSLGDVIFIKTESDSRPIVIILEEGNKGGCAAERNIKYAFVYDIKFRFLYPPTTYKSLGVTAKIAYGTKDYRLKSIDSMIDSGFEDMLNRYITSETVKENYAKVKSELEELHTKISMVHESGGARMLKKTK